MCRVDCGHGECAAGGAVCICAAGWEQSAEFSPIVVVGETLSAKATLELIRRSSPCDLPQGLLTGLYATLVPCNALGLAFVLAFYVFSTPHLRRYVENKMIIYSVGLGLMAVGALRVAYPEVVFGVDLGFTLLASSVGCIVIGAISVELEIWLRFLRKRREFQVFELSENGDSKIAIAMNVGRLVPVILFVVTSALEIVAAGDTARRPALLRGVVASVAVMGAAHSATVVWALRGVVDELRAFLVVDNDLLRNQGPTTGPNSTMNALHKSIEATLERTRTRIVVQVVYPILQAGALILLILDDTLFAYLKVILPAFYLVLSLLILLLTVQDIYGVARSSLKTMPTGPRHSIAKCVSPSAAPGSAAKHKTAPTHVPSLDSLLVRGAESAAVATSAVAPSATSPVAGR